MRKTVFLSSTGADLGPYRAQLIEDARGHDWFRLDAMEEFGARSALPIDFCRRRVEEADIFVGLIGTYRGWEPEGDNKQRSITEMEYDWAADAKKRRLMFVAPEDFSGSAPPADGEPGQRQRGFRTRVLAENTADLRCFGSAHALSVAVFKALFNEVMYGLAAQAQSALPGAPGQLNAAAMAGAVIAEVAKEENLSLEALRARGLGADEIEALLTEQKRAATARMTQHKEGEAQARKDAALAAKRLGSLAFLYDTAKALGYYAEAAALDGQDWEALLYLGRLHARAGDLSAAKQSYESLLARRESIENPYFIYWTYFLLGDVEAALGNRRTALDQYARGQALVQDLAARDPNNAEWQRDLSVSYERVGDISAARGDRDGALKTYLDGLEIRKQLAARDPSNAEWQRDLSVSYNKTGDISAARGDRDGALKAYLDGLEIRKQLAARDPSNAEWQRDLSVSYNRVGDISAARGDRDGALKAYLDGLEIAKRLAARDPSNVVWQTDLVVSAWKLASAGAEDAVRNLADGLAILKRLDGKGRLTADQKQWIGAFEAALEETEPAAPPAEPRTVRPKPAAAEAKPAAARPKPVAAKKPAPPRRNMWRKRG
jgi:tetratricopeptide (TPR) repeat protein